MSLILSGTDGLSDVDGTVATPAIRGTDTNTGIFFPAADTIAFAEGGAEAMRINSSGNVGIGTSSPAAGFRLDVVGGAIRVNEDGAGTKVIQIRSDWAGVDPTINVQTNHPLLFATNGTERARINSSGEFLVGTTTAFGNGFSVINNAGIKCTTVNTTNSTSATNVALFINPNGTVGFIQISGSSTSYNTSSDYRLKNITGPITTSGAYIDSLNPVEGTWKADGSAFVGLIAHEVQEASRTPVATGTKDGEQMQGMDYSSAEIIANMLAELKSLRARVAQLEAK